MEAGSLNWIDILTIVVALGAALMAGTFFAFSNFIMPGIDRQPPAHGIAVMNSINVTVLNPGFLTAFMGTMVLGLLLIVAVFITGGSLWAVAGALLYILGAFGVTMAGNVPMNNRLARVDVHSAEAATYWARYLKDWTLWNSARASAAFIATLLLILSLMR